MKTVGRLKKGEAVGGNWIPGKVWKLEEERLMSWFGSCAIR